MVMNCWLQLFSLTYNRIILSDSGSLESFNSEFKLFCFSTDWFNVHEFVHQPLNITNIQRQHSFILDAAKYCTLKFGIPIFVIDGNEPVNSKGTIWCKESSNSIGWM